MIQIKKLLSVLSVCGFIAKVLATILLVLTIHEYGHYTEMKKHNIEIAEFSIGIGMPLFQYSREDKVLVSLRLIPIMAYVMPSDKGAEKINTLPFFEFFSIYSAGARNNVFTGWVLITGMQFLSVFRRHDLSDFFKDFLFSPIRIVILFFGFTAAFFHKWGVKLVGRYMFEIYDVEKNEHINRVLWWSFCLGFLNFLPFSFFDGSKIFFFPILTMISNIYLIFLLSAISGMLFVFVFFVRGIMIGELVDYIN